ncbi:MAG: acyltransferase [Halorubrum sp.]
MTKRSVTVPPEVRARIDRYVDSVDDRLSGAEPTADVVREVLAELHGDGDAHERWQAGESVDPAERVRLDRYDPRNVLVKADEWAETDETAFREAKAIKWLWAGFDASPAANDLAFALPFRQMLATHLFADAGENLFLERGITFPCGHNIEMGDRTVVHRNVLLDDRGALSIGDRVSIADGATVHSHGHDVVDQTDVSIYLTEIEDDVRIASDAMVAAGCRVGENAMVGAKAVVRGDVPAHHIAVGAPAKSVRVKPGWASVAADPGPLTDRREQRRIEYDVPDDVDVVDEFQRDLSPPDGEDTAGD